MILKVFDYFKKIIIISELRLKFLLFLGLIIINSLIDIVNLALIIPVVSLLFDNDKVIDFKFIELSNINLSDETIIFLFILFFTVKSILSVYVYKKIVEIKVNLQAKLRFNLIENLYKIEFKDFLLKETSYYIHNITNVVAIYCNGLMSLLRFITESFVILAIIFYFIFMYGLSALFILFLFILLIIAYQIFFRKKITGVSLKTNLDTKNLIQTVKDAILGIKEIKVAQKENYFENHIGIKAKNLAKYQLFNELIIYSPRYLIEGIFVIFIFIYIYFNLDYLSGDINFIYFLSSFLYASFRTIPSLTVISRSLSILNNAVVSTNILFDEFYLKKKNENKLINSTKSKWIFECLDFKDVNYGHSLDNLILKNLNLTLKCGDNILIFGESGSGKTTIADLILGFYEPSNGKILINNSEINKLNFINNSYYLSQNKFLLNDSIFNNIVLDRSVNSYQMLDAHQKILFDKAIEITNLNKFIESKKEKENFIIGDSGNNLSGGQKQRIALARLVYQNRQFNILDEATSELDEKIELEILNKLLFLSDDKKTFIIISHNSNLKKLFKKTYHLKNNKLEN
tara:strand:- start:2469 stop:4187 length:1719 start_codon:yes stop_codon:yes gene_type:complete